MATEQRWKGMRDIPRIEQMRAQLKLGARLAKKDEDCFYYWLDTPALLFLFLPCASAA
jgi:hypothetical protein